MIVVRALTAKPRISSKAKHASRKISSFNFVKLQRIDKLIEYLDLFHLIDKAR